jgi:hypothetical protein
MTIDNGGTFVSSVVIQQAAWLRGHLTSPCSNEAEITTREQRTGWTGGMRSIEILYGAVKLMLVIFSV